MKKVKRKVKQMSETEQAQNSTQEVKQSLEEMLCRGWDSNPHRVFPQRILSPSRLPFRHPGNV